MRAIDGWGWKYSQFNIFQTRVTGASVPLGFHPSNLLITKLHLNGDRNLKLERKRRNKVSEKVLIYYMFLYIPAH